MNTFKSALQNFGLILVVLILWAYAISFNNATGWAMATIMTGIALLSFASLWPRLRQVNVQTALTVRDHQQYLTLKLPAKNPGVTVIKPKLIHPKRKLVVGSQPQTWQTTTPLPRGIYDQLQVQLLMQDPLHLIVKRAIKTLPAALVVPPILNQALGQQLYTQVQPLLQQPTTSTNDQPGFETRDFRPYQPGDPRNQIDWKLSARQGTPILRVLADDEPLPWCWIFMATSTADLETHLAGFYTFIQLAQAIPAQIILVGANQQTVTALAPDAFASYQPYRDHQVPTVNVQQHRVVLFGDHTLLAQDLLNQLALQNPLATAITWPGGGPDA